jgi:hypothetical protein
VPNAPGTDLLSASIPFVPIKRENALPTMFVMSEMAAVDWKACGMSSDSASRARGCSCMLMLQRDV